MRALRVLALLVLGFAVGMAPASAQDTDLPEKTPRHVLRAQAYLKRGRDQLERAEKKESTAAKLKALDRALLFLRRARGFTELDEHPALPALATESGKLLVTGLNRQARIYLDRKSLPLARKRVREALAIDMQNATTVELKKAVAAAEDGEDYFGSTVENASDRRRRLRRFRSAVPTTGRAAGRSR